MIVAHAVPGVIHRLLLDPGEDEDLPGAVAAPLDPGGQAAVGVVVVVHPQADLLEVVEALGAAGGLPRRLHGRQQQGRTARRSMDFPSRRPPK